MDSPLVVSPLTRNEQLESPSRRAFLHRFSKPSEVKLPASDYPRPPWAMNNKAFLAQCDRCHKCIDACPQRVLQASDDENEILNKLPILSLDYGSCDFCGQCVDTCPTNALCKEQGNRIQAVASVSNHCQLTYNQHCDLCIDACAGNAITINDNKRIEINKERCTGCGECALDCYDKAIKLIKR